MIPTRFGMANIKKTVPSFVVKQSDVRSLEKPSRFQKNIKVKVEVSALNSHAENLPL